MKILLPLIAALSATTMTAAPATAAPTVTTIMTCTGTGLGCSSASAATGVGTEFTGNFGGTPILGFDFSDNLLTVSNVTPCDYGVVADIAMKFTNIAKAFTSVSLVSNNGFLNLSQNNFTVTDGALGFSSSFFSAGKNATLTLRVGSAGAGAGAVPEPAAWAMMILGIGLIGTALRRQRGGAATLAA